MPGWPRETGALVRLGLAVLIGLDALIGLDIFIGLGFVGPGLLGLGRVDEPRAFKLIE